MIEDPNPTDWKQLQSGVCRLLSEVGLAAEECRKIQTPRGEIEIDVYAVDERSVDRIRYIVECKNWATPIPQSVVHGFTTVMQETGGNIGFIISREGFQSGARDYLRNTSIVGLTYLELQQRYFQVWWANYFVPVVGAGSDTLLQYVEPINSRRVRILDKLPADRQKLVRELQEKYQLVGMTLAFIGFSSSATRLAMEPPTAIDQFKGVLKRAGIDYSFSSIYFRDLAHEIAARAQDITDEFNAAFGSNIFA